MTKKTYLMNDTELNAYYKTRPYMYVISDPFSDSGEEWEFSTKEEFFNKMIELNHLDKYNVVHFKMTDSVFGQVHRHEYAIKKYSEDGCWSKRVMYFSRAACHKDGLHEVFLTNY